MQDLTAGQLANLVWALARASYVSPRTNALLAVVSNHAAEVVLIFRKIKLLDSHVSQSKQAFCKVVHPACGFCQRFPLDSAGCQQRRGAVDCLAKSHFFRSRPYLGALNQQRIIEFTPGIQSNTPSARLLPISPGAAPVPPGGAGAPHALAVHAELLQCPLVHPGGGHHYGHHGGLQRRGPGAHSHRLCAFLSPPSFLPPTLQSLAPCTTEAFDVLYVFCSASSWAPYAERLSF